jgi:alkylated DNA repair dioxygenase AlkB
MIPGLVYIPAFLIDKEEAALINAINKAEWDTGLKRRVQQYGYEYSYKSGHVDPQACPPLPDYVTPLVERLTKPDTVALKQAPSQLIINEYQPGQGISPHVDSLLFGEQIVSISLGSGAMMDFTNKTTKERVSIYLEPRSAILMQGDARYLWTHGIAHRKSDKVGGVKVPRTRRISLTFRTIA